VTGVLDGRAVVITGSGRGLGRAYALEVAAAGAAVVINDVDGDAAASVVAEIEEAGGRAVADVHSVADPDGARALVDGCIDAFGRLDGLVNNAGVLTEAPPWETTDEQTYRMVAVNVLGTIYCGHAAIDRMRTAGAPASIVNVTSGTHLGQPGLAVYGATKGAVASLTYGWALDLAGTNVRVNALSPLAITPMKLPPYDGHAHPAEVAAVITYLLSDASARLTGQLVRRARDQLGLIRHPAVGRMISGEWTLDAIADAFDKVLADDLEPVGFGAHLLDPRSVPVGEPPSSSLVANEAGTE